MACDGHIGSHAEGHPLDATISCSPRDDPNLVSCAGLVPVMALAARCGLTTLLTDRVQIAVKGGANATAKILALVAVRSLQ
ncbi:MAG: family transposase [Pseudonocardia sp.]|nr:family transposase [Pseudonocardia sp.]